MKRIAIAHHCAGLGCALGGGLPKAIAIALHCAFRLWQMPVPPQTEARIAHLIPLLAFPTLEDHMDGVQGTPTLCARVMCQGDKAEPTTTAPSPPR
jgi:hypothetical protein